MMRESDSPMADLSMDENDNNTNDKNYNNHSVRIHRDLQNCVPLTKVVSADEAVLLLTPIVPPWERSSDGTTDPFEPLGQAIAENVAVRHVPYSKSGGITGYHVTFIRRVKAVIFVVTSLDQEDNGQWQAALGSLVAAVCKDQPLLFVACCNVGSVDEAADLHFPTVVLAPGYSGHHLSQAAAILMGESAVGSDFYHTATVVSEHNERWAVEEWDSERDGGDVHAMWLDTIPDQFRLDRATLDGLLIRKGWSKHLVVRTSKSELVGFCATYTCFGNSSGDQLIGFIATILVKEEFRGRGIGTFLHNEAVSRVRQTQGVNRIQIGTAFPRLLAGVPTDLAELKWFEKRGWSTGESSNGRGRTVADWILRFTDIPSLNLASAGLSFRPCQMRDYEQVLETMRKESGRKLYPGVYDQYARTLDSAHMEDIIVGFEGDTLAATAITYIPNSLSASATDIPWPAVFGPDIGGVTCMFYNGEFRTWYVTENLDIH